MIDADDLPDGWVMTTGKNLFDFVRGVSFKKEDAKSTNESDLITILRAGNLQDGLIDLEDLVYVDKKFVSETQRLRLFDLIIAMSSGSASVVGKVSSIIKDMPDYSFGAFCGLIRPKSNAIAGWLSHFFQTQSYRQHISEQAAGVNINNLRSDHLFSLELPLPPLAEQKRIVARLEELQARSRAAHGALAEVPKLLEQYRQSVLAAAFRGDLTAAWREKNPNVEPASVLLDRIRTERRKQWETKYPKKKYVEPEAVDDTDLPELPVGWIWASSEEIVEPGAEIVYGIVQPGPVVADGVPYVRGCDIQAGEILVGQLLRTSREIADRYERASLQGGDVILGIIRATKVAVVPDVLAGANITQGTARFRPSSAITTHYLAGWLDTPFAQSWLHEQYRGIDMPGLNLRDVRRLPVALAPKSEQTKVAEKIKGFYKHRNAAIQASTLSLQELNQLDQSFLTKAFRGQLVPQDLADEPASVLLERIRNGGTTRQNHKLDHRDIVRNLVLLLWTYTKPLDRATVELALVLMNNDAARTAILDKTVKAGRGKATGRVYLEGLDLIFGGMKVRKWLNVSDDIPQMLSLGTKAPDTDDATTQDLQRVRETIQVIKAVEKDRLAAIMEKVCDVQYELIPGT